MSRAWLSLLGVIALMVGGCVQGETKATRAPRVLLLLQIPGGGAPTPRQAAQIQHALAPVIADAGFQLAERVDLADYLLTATFAPDPVDPEAGRLTLRSFEPARGNHAENSNPAAGTLREMQTRVENLERWALRSQIGR
jgi:hypothetical protein